MIIDARAIHSQREVKSKNSTIGLIFLWLSVSKEAFIGLTINPELEDECAASKAIIGSNADALAAFVSRKAQIDAMLTRLQSLSEDHFGYSPDEVTWAHVGTLEHYADLLKRVTEGEHAA
jgi:hypothetical protein